MDTRSTPPASSTMPRLPRRWRLAGLVLLGLALLLSFIGYLTPDMQLQWDTIAAMCGF